MAHDIFDFPNVEIEVPDVQFKPLKFEDIVVPTNLKPAQRRFLRAYVSAPGNITGAARKAGISRGTYYHWCNNDPGFKEALTNFAADIEDFVKSKLMEKIIQGNTRAIIFFLKTYGGPAWGLTNPLRRKERKKRPSFVQ